MASESAARGIALAVSAGLLDHEGTGAEETEDALGSGARPPLVGEDRGALEMGGEEIAAAEVDVAGSVPAPDAADQQGDSIQRAREPTSTPARWVAGQAEEGESAHARSCGRAHLRRGAQRSADELQAPAPAARFPPNPQAQDRAPRTDPSPQTRSPPTPARRPNDDDSDALSLTGHTGAAGGRAPRGIRVGRGSTRRGRRGTAGGRRGRGARGTNQRGSRASRYARRAEGLLREGAEGGEEAQVEETEEEDENVESDGGDPAFNPEREGISEAEAEEDEEELELLLQGAEFPNPQARGEPANQTTTRNRAARGDPARGGKSGRAREQSQHHSSQ
ncbi:unnamed protein product [Closterium sp. Yama58-4]|nr:unnamed protein product [Closterium sp. Yama58-4]